MRISRKEWSFFCRLRNEKKRVRLSKAINLNTSLAAPCNKVLRSPHVSMFSTQVRDIDSENEVRRPAMRCHSSRTRSREADGMFTYIVRTHTHTDGYIHKVTTAKQNEIIRISDRVGLDRAGIRAHEFLHRRWTTKLSVSQANKLHTLKYWDARRHFIAILMKPRKRGQ